MTEIIKLTKETLETNLNSFIELSKTITPLRLQYWNEQHFRMDFAGKWDYSLVAIDKNIIVGYIIATLRDKSCVHINKMVVSKEFRSKGIGEKLIMKLLDTSQISKISKVHLFTHVENIGAKKFYEKNGFKEIALIQDDSGEKRFEMLKTINLN